MELKKVVDYAVVMADGPQILVESILDQARSKTNCRNSLIQMGARKSTPASRKAVSGRLGILRTQLVQGVRCLFTQEWSMKWNLGLCIQGDSILQCSQASHPWAAGGPNGKKDTAIDSQMYAAARVYISD